MKRLFYVLAVCVFLFAASACKKEYACECTYSTGSGDTTVSLATAEFGSQSDADAWCNDQGASNYSCEAVQQ